MSAPDHERLRAELRAAAERSAGASIDLDGVLDASRRARRRRRNGIAGGTAAVAALVAAVGLTGVLSGIQGPVATTADAPAFEAPASMRESAPADGADAGDREAAVAPRDGDEAGELALGSLAQLNRCGEPVAPATDASASELHVSVDLAGVLRAGGGSTADVTVTNTGAASIAGAISATPSVAVVDDRTVVWLTNDAAAAATEPIDLAPGESVRFAAPVEARVCTAHGGGRLPDALVAGEYGISATVVFVPADATGRAIALVSPLAQLTVE